METTKIALSILIPVYNYNCVDFVQHLQRLVDETGIEYEIIVVDDASPDSRYVKANRELAKIPHCLYIIKEVNTGAAATRNFLARQSAYPYLLYLDCDMQLTDVSFFKCYLDYLRHPDTQVVVGGICVPSHQSKWHDNLRYRYEKAEQANHKAAHRQQRPYQSFRSVNFIVKREVMLQCPFDERFQHSGYEDVLFGKQLCQHHIRIQHIDNPLVLADFETNADYVAKVERSLRTLYQFRNELRGYSRLLNVVDGIHLQVVCWLIASLFRCSKGMLRRNLCSHSPNLTVFKLYRLGYYLNIKMNK